MGTVRTQICPSYLRRKKWMVPAGERGCERGRGSEARASGWRQHRARGDDLLLEAPAPPPPAVLDAVRSMETWAETKAVAKKVGGWTADILLAIAKEALKMQIKKHTGFSL